MFPLHVSTGGGSAGPPVYEYLILKHSALNALLSALSASTQLGVHFLEPGSLVLAGERADAEAAEQKRIAAAANEMIHGPHSRRAKAAAEEAEPSLTDPKNSLHHLRRCKAVTKDFTKRCTTSGGYGVLRRLDLNQCFTSTKEAGIDETEGNNLDIVKMIEALPLPTTTALMLPASYCEMLHNRLKNYENAKGISHQINNYAFSKSNESGDARNSISLLPPEGKLRLVENVIQSVIYCADGTGGAQAGTPGGRGGGIGPIFRYIMTDLDWQAMMPLLLSRYSLLQLLSSTGRSTLNLLAFNHSLSTSDADRTPTEGARDSICGCYNDLVLATLDLAVAALSLGRLPVALVYIREAQAVNDLCTQMLIVEYGLRDEDELFEIKGSRITAEGDGDEPRRVPPRSVSHIMKPLLLWLEAITLILEHSQNNSKNNSQMNHDDYESVGQWINKVLALATRAFHLVEALYPSQGDSVRLLPYNLVLLLARAIKENDDVVLFSFIDERLSDILSPSAVAEEGQPHDQEDRTLGTELLLYAPLLLFRPHLLVAQRCAAVLSCNEVTTATGRATVLSQELLLQLLEGARTEAELQAAKDEALALLAGYKKRTRDARGPLISSCRASLGLGLSWTRWALRYCNAGGVLRGDGTWPHHVALLLALAGLVAMISVRCGILAEGAPFADGESNSGGLGALALMARASLLQLLGPSHPLVVRSIIDGTSGYLLQYRLPEHTLGEATHTSGSHAGAKTVAPNTLADNNNNNSIWLRRVLNVATFAAPALTSALQGGAEGKSAANSTLRQTFLSLLESHGSGSAQGTGDNLDATLALLDATIRAVYAEEEEAALPVLSVSQSPSMQEESGHASAARGIYLYHYQKASVSADTTALRIALLVNLLNIRYHNRRCINDDAGNIGKNSNIDRTYQALLCDAVATLLGAHHPLTKRRLAYYIKCTKQ